MSACKECGQEADESMPARLEELGEGVDGAGVDGQRTPQMTRGGDASRVLCPCVEGKQGQPLDIGRAHKDNTGHTLVMARNSPRAFRGSKK